MRYFCDFSVIWDAKFGDSFQVHVFDDPGMEMLPECVAACARTIVNLLFLNGFIFSLIHDFGALWEGFGSRFGVFW